MYAFEGSEPDGRSVELSRRSCWLVGSERLVADVPLPADVDRGCDAQHAVLQFRAVRQKNGFGDREEHVRWVHRSLSFRVGLFRGNRIC